MNSVIAIVSEHCPFQKLGQCLGLLLVNSNLTVTMAVSYQLTKTAN